MADEKKKSAQSQVSDVVARQQADLAAANASYRQDAKEAADQYAQSQESLINEFSQGADAQRQTISEAYDSLYGENGLLGQAYKERQQELAEAQTEDARQKRIDYNTARWTGLTEVAASILNAIGVGNGASNQVIHPYSQDWMKKADADAKERRSRIDRIRENLATQKERLAQGRLQGVLALAGADRDRLNHILQMRGNLSSAQHKAAMDILGMGYQNDMARANAGAQGALQGISLGMQEDNMREGRAIQRAAQAQQAADLAQRDRQFNAKMAAKGFNPDGSVNPEYMSRIVTAGGSLGSGSGSNIVVTFGASGDIPQESIKIKSGSLLTTIQANLDLIPAEDNKRVQHIINDTSKGADEKAKALLPYIKDNKALRDIIKASASGASVSGETSAPSAPETDSNSDDEETGLGGYN